MGTVAQLGHLVLEVSDLGAWRRFARDVLGLAIGTSKPDGALPLRMNGHAHRFLLREGPADDVAHVGWKFASRAATDAMDALWLLLRGRRGGREIDDRDWEVKVYPGASDWGHRPVTPA
jgi:catechol 2,3-dioxygenase-like lactoylglutathione lyase family enzyme